MGEKPYNVFLSIGTPSNQQHEEVQREIINVLEKNNLRSRCPPRGPRSALLYVRKTLGECVGMIVVGYPRIIVREGVERPGTDKEQYLKDVSLTTPWNHMEAAFAFERELPLMVLRDRNLKVEGFMEHSVDWEVKRFDFTTEFVRSREFSSMVEQFYNEIDEYVEKCSKKSSESRSLKEKDFNVEDWTLGNLISAFSRLSLPDTMKVISIITTLLGGTFYLGHKLGDLIL